MKRIGLTIFYSILFSSFSQARGVIVHSYASHSYTEMRWFTGQSINCTAQMMHDTLSGSFYFRPDGIKANDDTKQFTSYGKIQRLILNRENGMIDTLDHMPDRNSFYKLVVSKNDLALYNQIASTSRSKNLKYATEYYFSNGKFSRPLESYFRAHKLSKRVVALLNQKFQSRLTEDSTPEEVLLLFKQ